jgi:sugar lactone lactonase YvrE
MPIVVGFMALGFTALGQTLGTKLNPGDILYSDSGNGIDGGFIIKVDATTGQQTVIASGGYLQLPFDVVIDGMGQIVVSDSGRIIRINPGTGNQQIIADNSRGKLGLPCGMAINRSGAVLAANLRAVVQVDPVTGQIKTVSAGGNFLYPSGVAIASNGQLFVLNLAVTSQIIRVNPQNGAQRVLTQGGYLKSPQAIAVQGDDIYVTDVATADGDFGVGRVIHVDAQSGKQSVISTGGYLVGPVGIALDASGRLIVGDPYTINPQSADVADGGYDGGIIVVDPVSGVQTLLARGQGGFVNPRGVAVVPIFGSKSR